MRLKALERLSLSLIKQQQAARRAIAHAQQEEGALRGGEQLRTKDRQAAGATRADDPSESMGLNAEELLGLAGASESEAEPKAEGAEGDGGAISSIFEEMIEHSDSVVDILPQLIGDSAETESMRLPFDRRDSTDSDIITAAERKEMEARIMRQLQQELAAKAKEAAKAHSGAVKKPTAAAEEEVDLMTEAAEKGPETVSVAEEDDGSLGQGQSAAELLCDEEEKLQDDASRALGKDKYATAFIRWTGRYHLVTKC
jgi:hypothetical protein